MGYNGYGTPDSFNLVNADGQVERIANIEPVGTVPTSGNALSTIITNPSVSIHDGYNSEIFGTIYETIPTSGGILGTDNPLLVVAPIYGKNSTGNIVQLETSNSVDGERLKVDSTITNSVTATITNPVTAMTISDGVSGSIKATVFNTIPSSGGIISTDNSLLVSAPIYAVNASGAMVPLISTNSGGDGERLKVDSVSTITNTVTATISNCVEPTRYVPRIYASFSSVSLTNETKTIFTYSGEGLIESIAVKVDEATGFSVRLDVDGVEIYTILISNLDIFGMPDGINISPQDFAAKLGFGDRYNPPVNFTTGFEVKVVRVGAAKNVTGIMVKYRIKV